MFHVTTWVACAALLLGGERPEDRVSLKNGRTLTGHVVYEDAERVILLAGTRERELEAAEVEGVESVVRALDVLLERLTKVGEEDLLGLLDLARYARAHRLPGEAEVLAWAVLAVAPDNVEAHELLGHKKSGESWRVKARGRSYRFADLAKLRADWGDAWKFSTTHYEVRTNLALADAVRITLDLERVYRDVYDFLAPELVLRDVTRPLIAHVHADVKSFPEVAGQRRSYFDPREERLLVNASGGYEPATLVHEAVHQFVWGTGAGRSSGVAELPGWVDEGLAEYLAAGVEGRPGRLRVNSGWVFAHHFDQHANARKPYKLSRVLSLSSGDFHSTSGLALKYAQSYTLVHFLLHGEDQAHREGFLEFLRGCWEGKSSTTHFKKSIDVRERDLEAGWKAYVASLPR